MKPVLFILFALLNTVFSDTATAQKKKSSSGQKTVSGGSSAKDMLSMLQGRWSSLEDKKTFFQIEGDKQINIYGRDILDTATINFYSDCPKRITTEDILSRNGKVLVVAPKPDNFYCYGIESISSQQLVLTYLPKGTIMRYRKVPTKKLEDYYSNDQ